MKSIPTDFYIPYFELIDRNVLNNPQVFKEKLFSLEIIRIDDTPKEITYFTQMFYELLGLFTLPFQSATFDFADPTFFNQIAQLGERFAKDTELKK